MKSIKGLAVVLVALAALYMVGCSSYGPGYGPSYACPPVTDPGTIRAVLGGYYGTDGNYMPINGVPGPHPLYAFGGSYFPMALANGQYGPYLYPLSNYPVMSAYAIQPNAMYFGYYHRYYPSFYMGFHWAPSYVHVTGVHVYRTAPARGTVIRYNTQYRPSRSFSAPRGSYTVRPGARPGSGNSYTVRPGYNTTSPRGGSIFNRGGGSSYPRSVFNRGGGGSYGRSSFNRGGGGSFGRSSFNRGGGSSFGRSSFGRRR